MKIGQIKATLIGHYGDDTTVANAARVSFHKEASNYTSEQNARLIQYLAKHKHFSPFNHCFLSFRVTAPIFVGRQLQKHRFMPWNEVSRRYVDEEPEFFLPDSWRVRPESNVKQGSGSKTIDLQPFPDTGNEYYIDIEIYFRKCLNTYNQLLEQGVAPEQARMVLPQNTMTEWIWSGTLGAYCDMLRLRLDEHTQYESRLVAQQIQEQIAPLFPVSMKALLEN